MSPFPRAVALAALTTAALAAALPRPVHAQDADGRRDAGRVAGRGDDVSAIERKTFRLFRENGPSVLSIRVITRAATLPRLVLPGVTLAPPGGDDQVVTATGFLATDDGHVVTTAAALRGASMVEVRFADGTVRDADVIGIDVPFRLAVLRTRAPGSPRPLSVPARVSRVNSALGWFFQASGGRPDVQIATVKAAAAESTTYDRYLYAAQSLLPGAAGGPLLDPEGRLLGVAVGEVRRSTPSRAASPVEPRAPTAVTLATLFVRGEDVHQAVQDIVRFGRVRRPLLGVILDGDSTLVDQLLPNGPAEIAGLREGDRLIGVDGEPVSSLADVTRALLRRNAGDVVPVELERDGATMVRPVRLSDVAAPALPAVPPLPGTMLEIDGDPDESGERGVSISSVVSGSSLHAAGLRAGDRLIRVDDRSALRFLARHRIRPAGTAPRVLEIERNGRPYRITLGR